MLETRPSKKQRELFTFISNFINEHGYGPSYREIMRALDYKSVSTVAVHVDGLVAHGWLRKQDNSARSLEVVSEAISSHSDNAHIRWLKSEVKKRQDASVNDEVIILMSALEILTKK